MAKTWILLWKLHLVKLKLDENNFLCKYKLD